MKKLVFGETPFDKMDHETLLRTCQRMYAALYSARNALLNIRDNFPDNPYLTDPRAVGGKSIELIRQTLEPIWLEYGDGNMSEGQNEIYYNFYNSAMPLLFSSKNENDIELGFTWNICLKCSTWSGVNPWNPEPTTACPMCDGEIRLITWDDLKPKPS